MFEFMLQDMYVPDESYYSTLGKIVDVEKLELHPASVKQDITQDTMHGQCARTSLWYYESCRGQNIRHICNVAVEDLPKLREKGCMMGNKFKLSVDASAVVCQMKNIFKDAGVKI